MKTLTAPDLWNDPLIAWYVKDEVVEVQFAQVAGTVMSSVGPNAYHINDALITGSNGDRWAVTPERFKDRYRPESPVTMGQPGRYRNIPVPIKAQCMNEAFSIARSLGADVLRGQAGDWLVQYSPTDYGIVDAKRFEQVYRPRVLFTPGTI